MNRRKHKKLSRRLVDAALVGEPARVRAALRAGAPAETADAAGSTPLYLASVNGDADIVRVLLAASARPDTESGIGSEGTPLCGAACWGHTEAVRALLEYGADRTCARTTARAGRRWTGRRTGRTRRRRTCSSPRGRGRGTDHREGRHEEGPSRTRVREGPAHRRDDRM